VGSAVQCSAGKIAVVAWVCQTWDKKSHHARKFENTATLEHHTLNVDASRWLRTVPLVRCVQGLP